MFPQDYSAIQRLENTDWETLKRKYVMSIRPEGSQLQAAQQMQKHIEDRDIVDYASYREAILRIFPASYFNLAAEIAGDIAKTGDGGYTFTATWYQFIVTQKPAQLPTALEKSQKCIVMIKAPGSRKLSSDIDTSIFTAFEGESAFFERAAERIKARGPDFKGRITNAVIEGFYTISEELFKKTSASHRDSNAYLDALANDQENYPKFLNDNENNPSIQGKRLFSEEEFTSIFKEFKYKKHVQEMAASLFSLRCGLEKEEWQAFKELVKKKLGKILRSELPKQEGEAHIASCQHDYDTIFQEVEKLHENHLASLNAKIQELNQLDPLPVCGQDIPIAARNRLYVEYLEKCAECYEKILALKSAKGPLKNELEAKKQALDEELNALEKLDKKSSHRRIVELVKEFQTNCALLEKRCQELKASLQQNILDIAQLQVSYQFSQILASTFAYEAYVGRSAIYHVVNEQSGKSLPISQQTLLGSALQQVGFKLLHTKELTPKKYPPEEIAYYTAKYGKRLFSLVFSSRHAELEEDILKLLVKGRTGEDFPKFTYLKSKQVRRNAYSTFTRKELALLNSQAKIINQIKLNEAILEAEKPRRTLELIQTLCPFATEEEKKRYFEKEKKLYLSISAKLIGLVCASRLKSKGYLWGKNPLIPLPHTTEEKKEEEASSPAIFNPQPFQNSNFPPSSGGGISKDEYHQLGEDAKNLVAAFSEGEAQVSHMEQAPRSQSAVVAGASEEGFSKLVEGMFKKSPK
ncbi:hypothetical protein [Parachlamydia sp. AcF125]|uniref:hypothetical protein n=1 Tax=Parachlamydia sp. AcF125 TaxID=2795736 RepID=UPI001BC99A07|nr:hypothetical protein [Parachlamydia sp. AcF125]MBS4168268.1 hypothetical protein [Parachlamydia sp. AcF125]